jgi:plasmid maintenance system antidote protein VapI
MIAIDIDSIKFVHNLPPEQIIDQKKQIEEHIKIFKNQSYDSKTIEETKETFNIWLNKLINKPIDPVYIIKDVCRKKVISKTELYQMTGIPIKRLKDIFYLHWEISNDEYRRFAIAFNQDIDYWLKLKNDLENWWNDYWDKGTTNYELEPTAICNGCGEKIIQGYGLQNVIVSGGYNSKYFFDLSSYQFSLCEKCLDKLFYTFHIPPKVKRDVDNENI